MDARSIAIADGHSLFTRFCYPTENIVLINEIKWSQMKIEKRQSNVESIMEISSFVR